MNVVRKIARVHAALKLGLLLVAGAVLGGCATLPQDDAGAELRRFENLRGNRYTEIFLIGGKSITMNLKAGVYNTVGRNSSTGKFAGITGEGEVISKIQAREITMISGVELAHQLGEGVAIWPKLTYRIPDNK
jgi:hypothetical protein